MSRREKRNAKSIKWFAENGGYHGEFQYDSFLTSPIAYYSYENRKVFVDLTKLEDIFNFISESSSEEVDLLFSNRYFGSNFHVFLKDFKFKEADASSYLEIGNLDNRPELEIVKSYVDQKILRGRSGICELMLVECILPKLKSGEILASEAKKVNDSLINCANQAYKERCEDLDFDNVEMKLM